jgi:hypothetical protein
VLTSASLRCVRVHTGGRSRSIFTRCGRCIRSSRWLRAEVLGVGGLHRERDGHIYVAESMSYESENWGTQRELMSRRCLRVGYGD